MPRKLPSQVPQTVSRLLEAGFLKRPPAWYEAVTNHPPLIVPPRQPVGRSDEDLPSSLKTTSKALQRVIANKAESSGAASNPHRHTMTTKKAKTLRPKLNPKPIVYDEDRVRKQFFRDHPWEAYRPTILTEMMEQVGQEPRVSGDPKRLRSYGRNPSVEDFVACTLEAHRRGGLSLSQAYHNTLSSYHGLKAEHEHASRYATLEAKYYGADLGKTETQRGFEKEDKALESWAVWAAGGMTGMDPAALSADAQQTKASRVKRTDDTFTSGDAYLDAAKAFREGKVSPEQMTDNASKPAAPHTTAPNAIAGISPDSADDFLGLASTAIRPGRAGSAETGALGAAEGVETASTSDVMETNEDQRYKKRVGTRGQRI